MPDIKKGISSITNLKKGSTDVNYVYKGINLVWQKVSTGIIIDTFYDTNAFGGISLNTTDGLTFSFETASLNINYIRI